MKIYSKPYLRRYAEVAACLTRHGLGWLADGRRFSGAASLFDRIRGRPRDDSQPRSRAAEARAMLEELGVAPIKIGQLLSTRPDLLPPDYIAELSKLQDSGPVVDFEAIRQVLISELGQPPEELFTRIEREPLASASIAQVHEALLEDGTCVVVKVQRPGVEEQVRQDMEVLNALAKRAAGLEAVSRYIDIEDLAAEFTHTLGNELDYTEEGRNADEFRANLADEDTARIPRVYWDYTTEHVLTMERLSGLKANDVAAMEAGGLDRRVVAENIVRIMTMMIFKHGFFHADPHPGNLVVLPDHRIGLLDLGMVGRLDNSVRESLIRLVMALINRDSERLVDELVDLRVAGSEVRKDRLQKDINRFIQHYHGRALKDVSIGRVFNELMRITLQHRLQLPSVLPLLFKVIAMAEDLASTLDPDFDLTEFAKPYVQKFWIEDRLPWEGRSKYAQNAMDLADLGMELPQRARRLANKLDRGDLSLSTRIKDMREFLTGLDEAINRLALSILAGSFIVALALVISVYQPPDWYRYNGWVFAGLLAAAIVFAISVMWSIWHSGRR